MTHTDYHPADDAIDQLRHRLTEPDLDEIAEDVKPWLEGHDLDDLFHLQDCPSCSYDVMRAGLTPPDIEVYDDHELGYNSRWLPGLSIDQLREELGRDGFSVTWNNVGR